MTQKELKQRLTELIEEMPWKIEQDFCGARISNGGKCSDHLIANGVTIRERARHLEEWGEDYGAVLWWKFPIEEPPYVGSPLDATWLGYHTHWTPITLPYCGEDMRGVSDE